MAQTIAETNGVKALLDEVQVARQEAVREDPDTFLALPDLLAIAYVLGRRNMPLSEAPRVRHLLELRERGHAV